MRRKPISKLNTQKKPLPCLGCGNVIVTDRCHRLCNGCGTRNNRVERDGRRADGGRYA